MVSLFLGMLSAIPAYFIGLLYPHTIYYVWVSLNEETCKYLFFRIGKDQSWESAVLVGAGFSLAENALYWYHGYVGISRFGLPLMIHMFCTLTLCMSIKYKKYHLVPIPLVVHFLYDSIM